MKLETNLKKVIPCVRVCKVGQQNQARKLFKKEQLCLLKILFEKFRIMLTQLAVS